VDTDELRKALKLANVIAVQNVNLVRLVFMPSSDGPGKVVITANAAEVGSQQIEVEGSIEGDEVTTGMNATYLIESLAAIPSPQVVLELNSGITPMVIKPIGIDGVNIHVVMPLAGRNNT
jgi:DNA polymerase-3 subunit beta